MFNDTEKRWRRLSIIGIILNSLLVFFGVRTYLILAARNSSVNGYVVFWALFLIGVSLTALIPLIHYVQTCSKS